MEVARQLYGRVTGEAVYVAEPVSAPARRGSPTKGCLGAMRLVAGPRRGWSAEAHYGFLVATLKG
ncbi:UDP-glycosyltransferase 71B1 [Zea mays]|uniref:UDP-glycosyltransferase 71B1 n=1 Tax=Zea mays TaxID=4577 RepID=A0A1D6JR69_MAIZE|nr:UDP-glycosyltransferase 71B1 [Zea mays]